MRLFEILLVLSCFTLFISVCFTKKAIQKTSIILSAANTVLLLVHLIFEGYRWQMLFIYVISLLLTFTILLKYLKKQDRLKIWKPLKFALYLVMAVLYAMSICLSIYLPVFNLPKPTGKYAVGTETFHFTDNKRDELLTKDSNDKRELMVQLWYPAKNTKGLKSEPLFPGSKATIKTCIKDYAENFSLPEFALDYWKYNRTNSYKNAKLLHSNNQLPVVIIDHGMGTGKLLHISQAENLASHGYIVAAVDHTYSTAATAFPDGKVTSLKTIIGIDNMDEENNRVGEIWEQDIEFLINRLEKLNSGDIKSRFAGSMDLENLGIMGHSFGGATAFNALNLSDKIKAGIDMDGSLFKLKGNYKVDKPFMLMTSQDYKNVWGNPIFDEANPSDKALKAINIKRSVYNKLKPSKIQENKFLASMKKNGGTIINIKGTEHFNFTDLQLYSKLLKLTGLTGKIDGKRGATIVNQYVLDFFNKYLKGTGGNLISGPNAKYPEVKFH